MKLTIVRVSEHKTVEDALGEAKHQVVLPRLITKNEDKLKAGNKVVVTSVDPSRRTNIVDTVWLGEEKPKVVVNNHARAMEFIFKELVEVQKVTDNESLKKSLGLIMADAVEVANGAVKPIYVIDKFDPEVEVPPAVEPAIKVSRASAKKRGQ